MNLFNLHSDPTQLARYDEQWKLPANAWELITDMHYNQHKDTSHLAKYIKMLPYRSYIYARDIMDGKRFLEAEPYILEDPNAAASYYRWIIGAEFNNGGENDVIWPEAEEFYNRPENKVLKFEYENYIQNWH